MEPRIRPGKLAPASGIHKISTINIDTYTKIEGSLGGEGG
jgi:hypothetical protein